jgi:hypothetical protein
VCISVSVAVGNKIEDDLARLFFRQGTVTHTRTNTKSPSAGSFLLLLSSSLLPHCFLPPHTYTDTSTIPYTQSQMKTTRSIYSFSAFLLLLLLPFFTSAFVPSSSSRKYILSYTYTYTQNHRHTTTAHFFSHSPTSIPTYTHSHTHTSLSPPLLPLLPLLPHTHPQQPPDDESFWPPEEQGRK